MAIGFPASFFQGVELTVPRENARVAIDYAFELLGWNVLRADRETFEARVPMSGLSWGERIRVSIAEPGRIEVRSVCSYPLQLFDWGKNRRNVAQFIELFELKAIRDNKLASKEPEFFDSSGRTPIQRAFDENG